MKKIWIAVAVVLALAGAGAYAAFMRRGAANTAAQIAPTEPGAAEEQLVAEAKVVPVHSAALSLPSGGIVADVLVAEGDPVQAGQPLLRLDRVRAMAAVAQAEAGLVQAQAAYEQLRAGATPEEI